VKLIASLIVRNELKRYLEPCVAHLLEFCDEIRVLDDRSDDGTREWLAKQE
jgi:glycosyltransferase involved in cell wall biosynthesis